MPTTGSTVSALGQTTTEIAQQDDDDDDWDEGDDSLESDDDGRVYKNPRNSPSTDCPRDEEQATLLGQKCLRKCSSDEDCKSKKKKCLCDGVCGNSCIKPGKQSFIIQVAFLIIILSARSRMSRVSTAQFGFSHRSWSSLWRTRLLCLSAWISCCGSPEPFMPGRWQLGRCRASLQAE